MNEGKFRIFACVVVVAAVLWFVPAPEKLRDASVIAQLAQHADIRVGDAAQLEKDAELNESLRKAKEKLGTVTSEQRTRATKDRNKLGQRAWRLFVLFAATIALILLSTMPIFTAAIGGLSVAVLTGLLTPAEGYSGFAKDFIILIVVAFTIAIGVAKSGLGKRLAWMIISRFGSSSLGLGYSLALTDILISPAFPSNTARSGVLFPIVDSVARGRLSPPDCPERRKLGAFLVMNSIAGLSLSSALWLTAMSANPQGAEIASAIAGVDIDFLTWFKAASVPVLVALVLVPMLLYRFFTPELRKTPEAPAAASKALEDMGPMSRNEWIMAIVFTLLVLLWAAGKAIGLNNTAVAIGGLFLLMITRVISLDDIRSSNGPITFAWFASLFTLSTHLDKFGFMYWVGDSVADVFSPFSWPVVYVLLVLAYVLIHYFFVSQTAHMFAVMPIFLTVGVVAGVPGGLLAMMLLLATNFFSPLTPQASSANAIFVGSGYVTMGEVYRYGGLVTLINTIIFMTVGTAWLMFVMG